MTINLVREQTISYDERGLADVHDDLYIKVDTALADHLRELKGARLSVFIYISLHEAHIWQQQAAPVTLQTIAEATGYDYRTVWYTVKWLEQHEFISESEPTRQGAKTYRPKAFAWFGHAMKKHQTPENFQAMKPVVVGTEKPPEGEIASRQQQQSARTREIFQSAGIVGRSLDRLGDVPAETAQAWADWIGSEPRGVRNPQGIAVSALSENPQAEPPFVTKAKERKRQPYIQLSLAAQGRLRKDVNGEDL